MLGKRYNWVPLLRAWYIWVNSDPSTQKYGSETAPHDVPDGPATRKVGAMICVQRAPVDRWYRVRVNKYPLKQVIDQQEKQHCDGEK